VKIFCLGIILFCVIVIVVGIISVHELPGKIARRRGHPQAEAIRICSLLGLVIFPFWMVALLWAYMRPVFAPLPPEIESTDADHAMVQAGDGGQV
jgi:hypothetical protein